MQIGLLRNLELKQNQVLPFGEKMTRDVETIEYIKDNKQMEMDEIRNTEEKESKSKTPYKGYGFSEVHACYLELWRFHKYRICVFHDLLKCRYNTNLNYKLIFLF